MAGPTGASKECKKIACEFLGIPIKSARNFLQWSEALYAGENLNCNCCNGQVIGIKNVEETTDFEYLMCIKCCCIYRSEDNPLFSLESIGCARPFVLTKVESCSK